MRSFIFTLLSTFTIGFAQIFNVKPYLQNVTPTSIHIMWETSGGDENVVHWNAKDNHGTQMPAGVYFYKIVSDDFTETKKMVLLK